MDDLEKSLLYERVCSELFRMTKDLKKCAIEASEKARIDGEEVSGHYDILKKELNRLSEKYRKLSDDAHKRFIAVTPVVNEYGLEELWNAVVTRAALDYEIALCDKDETTLKEVEQFLGEDSNILSRIRADYDKFVVKAHKDIHEILKVKPLIKKHHSMYNDPINKQRCPLCGGGLYAKTQLKSNLFLVACGNCELTEVVTLTPYDE